MMVSRWFSCSRTALVILILLAVLACGERAPTTVQMPCPEMQPSIQPEPHQSVTLFMCGDVMTGRGIDQILPHPSAPVIHEPFMKSAQGYVELAERASGPIQKPVDFPYIWGDALAELERAAPDVRLINLETSVTQSDQYWRDKGIHYRMHPQNLPCLTAAGIDCCALANNHVLDWGYAGLRETLQTLEKASIQYAGAGRDLREAQAPAVMEVEDGERVLVFAYGVTTSGIPSSWAASEGSPGVNLLPDLSDATVRQIKEKVEEVKRQGDVVVASIHWGGNWGYTVPPRQIEFAHKLIDEAHVDVIHGHSSHHVKAVEVYRGRPIIYGAGDFINDYEGIEGYEEFRPDLTLMYFVRLDPSTGELVELRMTPMQIKHLRLNRASETDARWLRDLLNREGERFGTGAELNEDSTLTLRWE